MKEPQGTQTSGRFLRAILDYLIIGVLLYYFIAVWKRYPFSIGGSLVLVSLIAIGYYLSLVRKEFSTAFTLFSLALLSIIGFNFAAYLEVTHGLTKDSLIIFFGMS